MAVETIDRLAAWSVGAHDILADTLSLSNLLGWTKIAARTFSGGEELSRAEFADLVIERAKKASEFGPRLVVEDGCQCRGEYPPVDAAMGKGDPLTAWASR